MKEARPFFGGVPTEPDVNRLMKEFEPKSGTVVSHEAVEAVLGLNRSESRYRTVTTAWRRRLFREENVDTVVTPGHGFRFLREGERVRESVKDFGRNVRGIGRSLRRISAVRAEVLTDQDRAKHDHGRRLIAATLDGARRAQKELAAPKPIAQLPRASGEK